MKFPLGILFLFKVILGGAPGWQMVISGGCSLVAAILVARDSSRVRDLQRAPLDRTWSSSADPSGLFRWGVVGRRRHVRVAEPGHPALVSPR